MIRYGLIGRKLGHSFSATYFNHKFADLGLTDRRYDLFELATIAELPHLLALHPSLAGLNVTIPYKASVLAYTDWCSPEVEAIGASNCLRIAAGRTEAFNTDCIGFDASLPILPFGTQALILGTGGAAKAVAYVLQNRGVEYTMVSRQASEGVISYAALNAEMLAQRHLIVNTTPLGMYPDVDDCPPIPYEALTRDHMLYDLVYNPVETLFLRKGGAAGAKSLGGMSMLVGQAEAAWRIWNSILI